MNCTVSEHAKSKAHANVISELQSMASKKLRSNFLRDEQKEEKKDNKYLEVTARIIRTVYVVNKLSLPFSDHTALVTLQKLNGLNMGSHNFERSGCTKMTQDISNHMHDSLIDSLIESNMPISIFIDDSTDKGNIHYKIAYF